MAGHQVVTLTAEDRRLLCAGLRANGVAAQAKIFRNVVVCASAVLLASRAMLPAYFEPYGETGLSMGSIRAMPLIASLLAIAHEWSSRVRRDDILAACDKPLSIIRCSSSGGDLQWRN